MLGAFDGRKMVGVLFGFTAVDGKKPYHYSHITGVARQYQSSGVGFKLKLAQRRHVIGTGQDLVKWTYDPLQAGNASFNIRKLGTICRTYKRNFYGVLDDSLNRGRLTDRFEVEWWVKSRHVKDRILGKSKPSPLSEIMDEGAQLANETEKMGKGNRRAVLARLGLTSRRILVEIPESIVKVREESLDAAKGWTMNVRRIFENYFRRGYVVVDVLTEKGHGERRVFYLLGSNFRF